MYRPLIGFAGILVANLVAALDAASLSVALPTIASELQATSIQAYWAGTAFVLSSAACQPLFPAFSNAFGRRSVVIFALSLLILGSIVCGSAQGISALLAGRTIQGIGGGGILAMTYTIMTDLFTLRRRSVAVAVNGMVWLLGAAVGPVMGGLLSTSALWRCIFWICLPLLVISLVLVSLFLGSKKDNSDQPEEKHCPTLLIQVPGACKRIDWIGAASLVASLTAFLVPVSWGGIMFPWQSWQTLVPLVIGLVGLASWVSYEHTFPSQPMVPLSLFNNRTTSCALLGTFVIGIIQFGLVFYLPLYYQVVKGYSAVISGVALLPITLVSGLSTAITGMVIAKAGRYKISVLTGWTVLALGCGLLELLDLHTKTAEWIFISAASGLGGGILFTALTMAAQAHVAQEHIAIAAALTPFVRALGQAIGITAGNSIIQNGLKRSLQKSSFDRLRTNAGAVTRHMASPRSLLSIFATSEDEVSALLAAFSNALKDFWWFLLAMALLAGLLSLMIVDLNLEFTEKMDDAVVISTTSSRSDSSSEGGPIERKSARSDQA